LKAFQVDLKTWFYLTNAAPLSSGKIEAGFWYFMGHAYFLVIPKIKGKGRCRGSSLIVTPKGTFH